MQNSDPTEKTLGQKLRSLRRHREKTPQQLADLLEISRSGYNKKEDGEGNFEAKTITQLSEFLDVGEDYFWLNLSPEMYDLFEESKLLIYSFVKLEKKKRDWLLELLNGAELVEKIGAKDPEREAFNSGVISKKRQARLAARNSAKNSPRKTENEITFPQK
jgi:transcriptional regulator with XRE-family HTH domain